ncbi:DUF308 domain-containing protein [Haloferax volcanii]|uniref:DUF308 domain-containing protein n=1 Tax=Haloferax volcanii TaxID=2246 RepID=UPI003852C94A
MSRDSQPTREFEEFSTTEEARKQIWNIKDIAITAFLLALAVSLIAAGVHALLQTYFGPVLGFSTSWITVGLGVLILIAAGVFIFEQYRPQTTLTKQVHAPLFYLVGEGTAFPMSTHYYPQQMAKIAFPALVETDSKRKEQMQDANPTFQGDRSVFTEFYEFLLIFWLHTNLPTHDYRDDLQEIRKVEPSDLDERLQENTFIDFFTDFDGDDMSTRQFTQLQPRLPEDVDLIYRGSDDLDQPGTTTNSFAIELDADWCSLEILVTCIPGHSVSPIGGNGYQGMPLDPLDARKIQHYSFNDQGPVVRVNTHVDVTVDYTFRHLLFSRRHPYDPNAYISWLEATAQRLQDDQLDDIHQAITTIQRSIDQVPDPDTIDEDFFHDHLTAIEEQWQRWQPNNDPDTEK